MSFLIYSYEHKAWWKAHRAGYTTDASQAGHYSQQEALAICWDANRYGHHNEVLVPNPFTQ